MGGVHRALPRASLVNAMRMVVVVGPAAYLHSLTIITATFKAFGSK